jgi:hypothetical protein
MGKSPIIPFLRRYWLNRDNLRQCQPKGEAVRPTFRGVLADSHIAAVSIAVLLLRGLESGVKALQGPLFRCADFLVNAVAIRGIPYGSGTFTLIDLAIPLGYLTEAMTAFAAAWLVSRWVYGLGPFCSLSKCRARLTRRSDV